MRQVPPAAGVPWCYFLCLVCSYPAHCEEHKAYACKCTHRFPCRPGVTIAKVLTLTSFARRGETEVRQGKELVFWKSVDREDRQVDIAVVMQQGSVSAKVLALYAIPCDGLKDTVRVAVALLAAMALPDEHVCVQPYQMVPVELTDTYGCESQVIFSSIFSQEKLRINMQN